MACGQRHELVKAAVEKLVAGLDEPVDMRLREGCKSSVDLAFRAGFRTRSCTPFVRAAS